MLFLSYLDRIENIYLALVYRQAFWQNGYVDSINEKNLQFYQDMTERAFQRIKNDYKVDLFQFSFVCYEQLPYHDLNELSD